MLSLAEYQEAIHGAAIVRRERRARAARAEDEARERLFLGGRAVTHDEFRSRPVTTCYCGADLGPAGAPADMCAACVADLPRRRARHAMSLRRGEERRAKVSWPAWARAVWDAAEGIRSQVRSHPSDAPTAGNPWA
jgi:hypothetical protein